MTEVLQKKFDLEERTFTFAHDVGVWCRNFPKDLVSIEYVRQVVRSSGSIGANYIEANESLSKKDFALRIRISRKEAKETSYWLRLLLSVNLVTVTKVEGERLLSEVGELKKILSSILLKSA